MRQLLEFNDQVCVNVSGGLVAQLLEDQLSALRETGLHLNLLYFTLGLRSFGVKLHNLPLVASLLDGATVEFFEGAVECDNNIGWLSWLGLVQASKTICKDALLHVIAGNVAVIREEISILELLLKVALSVHLHEVSATNSLALWSYAALLQTILAIDVIDRLIFNCKRERKN